MLQVAVQVALQEVLQVVLQGRVALQVAVRVALETMESLREPQTSLLGAPKALPARSRQALQWRAALLL